MDTAKYVAIDPTTILAILVFLIIATFLYSFYQSHLKLKTEKEMKKNEKDRVKQQLALTNKQVNDYLKKVADKNEAILTTTQELAQAKAEMQVPDIEKPDILEQRETLIKKVISSEKEWVQFRRAFERSYPDFLPEVQRILVNLKPADIRLLILLKLEFTNKEMAFMLSISTEAIWKGRQRLRKRIESSGSADELRKLIPYI